MDDLDGDIDGDGWERYDTGSSWRGGVCIDALTHEVVLMVNLVETTPIRLRMGNETARGFLSRLQWAVDRTA